MTDERKPNRFQKRLKRIRIVKEQEVSPKKRAIAAGVAATFAVLTLYGIFASFGLYRFDWKFFAFAAVMGFVGGLIFGAKRVSEGAAAGVLAGLWIFMEVMVAGVALAIEAFAAALGAIFSGFSL